MWAIACRPKALVAGIDKEKKLKGEESVLAPTTLKHERLSIASEMIDHLAAGHETSAITLTYLSWQLSLNIPLQDALRAELLALEPNMLLQSSESPGSIPNPRDLDSLPLLHAVLMETLTPARRHPGRPAAHDAHPILHAGRILSPWRGAGWRARTQRAPQPRRLPGAREVGSRPLAGWRERVHGGAAAGEGPLVLGFQQRGPDVCW